jgi:hypothetical protein
MVHKDSREEEKTAELCSAKLRAQGKNQKKYGEKEPKNSASTGAVLAIGQFGQPINNRLNPKNREMLLLYAIIAYNK